MFSSGTLFDPANETVDLDSGAACLGRLKPTSLVLDSTAASAPPMVTMLSVKWAAPPLCLPFHLIFRGMAELISRGMAELIPLASPVHPVPAVMKLPVALPLVIVSVDPLTVQPLILALNDTLVPPPLLVSGGLSLTFALIAVQLTVPVAGPLNALAPAGAALTNDSAANNAVGSANVSVGRQAFYQFACRPSFQGCMNRMNGR